MRSILALSLLITVCGSANAATDHAHRRHAIVGPNQGMIASDPASSFAYEAPGPPIQYRSAPYNATMDSIREPPRVTRLANANDFSTV